MARLVSVFLLLAALGISLDAKGISGSPDDTSSIPVELGHDVGAFEVRRANQDDREVDEENKKAFSSPRRPRTANQNRDEETQSLGVEPHRNSRSLPAGNILPSQENGLVDFGMIANERALFLWMITGHGSVEGDMGLMADEYGDESPRMRREDTFESRQDTDKKADFSRIDLADNSDRAKRQAPNHRHQDSDHVSCFHRRRRRPTTTTTTTTTSSPDKDTEPVDEDAEELFENEVEDELGALVKNRTKRSTPQKSCYPTRNVSPPRTTQRREQGGRGSDKIEAIRAIVSEILTTIRATAGAVLSRGGAPGAGGALGGGGAPGGGGAVGGGGTGVAGTGGARPGGAGGGAGFGGSAGGAGGAAGGTAGGGAGSAGGTGSGGGGAGGGGGAVGGGGSVGTPTRGRNRARRATGEWTRTGLRLARSADDDSDSEARTRGGRWGGDKEDASHKGGVREGSTYRRSGQGMGKPREQGRDDGRDQTGGRRSSKRPGRETEQISKLDLDRIWYGEKSNGKDGFFKRMWKKAKNYLGIGKNNNSEAGNAKNVTVMGGGIGKNNNSEAGNVKNVTVMGEEASNTTLRTKRGVKYMFNKVKEKVMGAVNKTVTGLGAMRSVHQSGEAIFSAQLAVDAGSSASATGAERANREVNDAEENNRENSNTFPEPGGIDTGLRQKRDAVAAGDNIQGWLQSALSGKLGGDDQNQRKNEDNKDLAVILGKITDLARNLSASGVAEAAAKAGLDIAGMARGLAANVTEKMSGKRGRKTGN